MSHPVPESPSAIRVASRPLWGLAAFAAVPIILAMILVPLFKSARQASDANACLKNLRRCAAGMLMYAEENDGGLPPASAWMDKIERYTATEPTTGLPSFRCPSVRQSGYGYAMSDGLSLANLGSIRNPGKQPMLFESGDLSRNAHAKEARLPDPPRHLRNGIVFADGRVGAPTIRQ